MASEKPMLRISGIVEESIVDGPGIRYVIFVQGCPHGCPGCHNPQTHDFALGRLMDEEETEEMLHAIGDNPLLSGVTFSGGEPFCQPEGLAFIAGEIRRRSPRLGIMVYSGYTYEALAVMSKSRPAIGALLDMADILVDGPYIEAQRNLTLKFRGSENQRVIDLKKTRETGTVTLYQDDYCQGLF